MKLKATLLAGLIAIAVAGCASSSTKTVTESQPVSQPQSQPASHDTWPAVVQAAFLQGCENTSTQQLCTCAMSNLESSVSLATVASYQVGTYPEWLLRAVTACEG